MKTLKYIVAAVTIILCGCTKDEPTQISIEDKYTIHVVGTKKLMTGGLRAMYWRNGVATELTPDLTSSATAIVVVGNDVYISGEIENKACYWKNGAVNYLPEGDEANDIKVIGNDIYVAGENHIVACYWKNGVKTTLGNNIGNSLANKIIIEGNDVYVAGGQSDSKFSYNFVALYWKNDKENLVVDNGMCNAIGIKGNDVYVAGYIHSDIQNTIFWKNNTAVTYPIEKDKYITITDLELLDNDIYTVGAISGDRKSSALCWKNSSATTLASTEDVSSSANDITIIDNVTFICGEEFSESTKSKAKIWINNKETFLSDGKNDETALGLFVVKL